MTFSVLVTLLVRQLAKTSFNDLSPREKAKKVVEYVEHTMALEGQKVEMTEEENEQWIEELVNEQEANKNL